MIVVGSRALAYYGMARNTPKDRDIWVEKGSSIYYKHSDVFYVSKEILSLIPTRSGFATPDAIYTIKCSHFAYDIKWEKTKNDILWLKAKGCVLIPKLYEALKKVWKVEHGNKEYLSLKKKTKDFFNDHVTYKYDHDYLHELVSFPNTPVYTRCLSEDETVFIDKEKFFSLPRGEQLRMFKEEITVIAMERWVINGTASWFTAYSLSLKKTITRLTKNWACDFIIDNLDFYTKADFRYFKNILTTLELENKNMDTIEKTFMALMDDLKVEEELQEVIFQLAEDDVYLRPVDSDSLDYEEKNKLVQKVLSDWEYKHISCEGGGEGGAEACEAIFSLKGEYFKVQYQYRSHEGYEYSDIAHTLTKVTPKEKTVTVFT